MPDLLQKVKLKDNTGSQVYPEIDPADKGTIVDANPTLAGTEADLTGIQVGETKYKVATGGAVDSVNGKTGAVVLDKTDIGLSNVDNTSDLNKPVSTAMQNVLDTKQNTLVSGTNIKTINNESILGSGNITISGGTEVIANAPATGEHSPDLMAIQIDGQRYKVFARGIRSINNQSPGGVDRDNISLKSINGENLVGLGDIYIPITVPKIRYVNEFVDDGGVHTFLASGRSLSVKVNKESSSGFEADVRTFLSNIKGTVEDIINAKSLHGPSIHIELFPLMNDTGSSFDSGLFHISCDWSEYDDLINGRISIYDYFHVNNSEVFSGPTTDDQYYGYQVDKAFVPCINGALIQINDVKYAVYPFDKTDNLGTDAYSVMVTAEDPGSGSGSGSGSDSDSDA